MKSSLFLYPYSNISRLFVVSPFSLKSTQQRTKEGKERERERERERESIAIERKRDEKPSEIGENC
jgi:hypothetical protein